MLYSMSDVNKLSQFFGANILESHPWILCRQADCELQV